MDRNLALEFVRVTEAAALSCAPWMGKGDKHAADNAAVVSMRKTLNDLQFNGVIIIGEGEKDNAPMLYSGEKLGKNGTSSVIEIAVDPLECTANLANGRQNSISVLAAGPEGSLLKVPGTYMEHIVVGKQAAHAINLEDSVTDNLTRIAQALDKDLAEITVCILDRPKHQTLISEIRKTGVRIKLLDHGTVSGAIAAAVDDSGIDVLMGEGGAPETIIIAAAIKCIGGAIQARIKPHNEKSLEEAKQLGIDLDKIYHTEDLAKGNNLLFAATGVSDGPLLKGVVFKPHGAVTHSMVIRAKSKTLRYIEAYHHFEKNPEY